MSLSVEPTPSRSERSRSFRRRCWIVSWTPSPADQTDHFEVVASESVQGTDVRAAVGREVTSVALTGLKASTTYAVTVLSVPGRGVRTVECLGKR